jgi:hypothetical protein
LHTSEEGAAAGVGVGDETDPDSIGDIPLKIDARRKRAKPQHARIRNDFAIY